MDTGDVRLPGSSSESSARSSSAESADSYRRLAEVFHDVLSEESLDALLERIADTLAELVPHDTLTIYSADETQRALVPVLARDRWAAEILSTVCPFGTGVTGWAVEHREPVHVGQLHLDPRAVHIPGTPINEPEALVAVPLIARGRVKGALSVYRTGEENDFSADEFELAKRFGDAAALALDNAEIRIRLEYQAQTDSLTGLYNHRTFHERLRSEVSRAVEIDEPVAVLMLDIDDFKRVNDVHGHAAGDEVLARIARLLRRTVRGADVVCRIGGEEFAVILPGSDTQSARVIGARLGDAIGSERLEACGSLSASMGIAHAPLHAGHGRELALCAEAAMMTAKSQGKNQIVVFDAELSGRPQSGWEGRDARSLAHLKLLQTALRRLLPIGTLAEVGSVAAEEACGLLDLEGCGIYLVDGEQLTRIAGRGDPPEASTLRIGQGIAGRAAASGETVKGAAGGGPAGPGRWIAAVPLAVQGRVTGVVSLGWSEHRPVARDDLRLMEFLAGYAAVALDNARRYDASCSEAARAALRVAELEAAPPPGRRSRAA
jgi:diguanylate cyclase (GGDEF)-like protein